MKAYQFEIIVLMVGEEPLYRSVTGLNRMYNSLTYYIEAMAKGYIQRNMDITGWRLPTLYELRKVQRDNITIDYTITCKNSDHDIVFRVSRKEA